MGRTTTWKRGVSGLCVLVATLLARSAGAGNESTYLIGGRAAGMAGAYTALADEASVAWYNPAGLGFNDRSSLDVSATTYSLQVTRVPAMLVTDLPSGTRKADYQSTSVMIIPNALTYLIKIGGGEQANHATTPSLGHSLALSVFVPNASRQNATFNLSSQEAAATYFQKIRLELSQTEYYAGPSYALRIGDRWALGASAYLVYVTRTASALEDRDVATAGDQHIFINERMTAELTGMGMVGDLGVQTKLSNQLRLGVSVRSPAVLLYRLVEADATAAAANSVSAPGAAGYANRYVDNKEWKSDRLTGWSVRAGLAWVQPQQYTLALDGSFHAGLSNDDLGVDRRPIGNVRAGAEVFLHPRFLLSVGGFTDFSPVRKVVEFNDMQVDFFGGTLSATHLSHYDVVGSPKTDRIVFSTTVGVKYAYGTGKAGGAYYRPADNEWRSVAVSATVHDVALMLGSSVRF